MVPKRPADGFTLVEVMVAISVLAVISLTVLSGVMYTVSEGRRAYDRAQAAAWVQSELDFLRLQGYGIPVTAARRIPDTGNPLNDPTTGYLPDYGGLSEPRVPQGFYQAEIQVTQINAGTCTPACPLKQLTVRLYQSPSSPPYTILATYVSQFNYP